MWLARTTGKKTARRRCRMTEGHDSWITKQVRTDDEERTATRPRTNEQDARRASLCVPVLVASRASAFVVCSAGGANFHRRPSATQRGVGGTQALGKLGPRCEGPDSWGTSLSGGDARVVEESRADRDKHELLLAESLMLASFRGGCRPLFFRWELPRRRCRRWLAARPTIAWPGSHDGSSVDWMRARAGRVCVEWMTRKRWTEVEEVWWSRRQQAMRCGFAACEPEDRLRAGRGLGRKRDGEAKTCQSVLKMPVILDALAARTRPGYRF